VVVVCVAVVVDGGTTDDVVDVTTGATGVTVVDVTGVMTGTAVLVVEEAVATLAFL
jgi:hypothetical protein